MVLNGTLLTRRESSNLSCRRVQEVHLEPLRWRASLLGSTRETATAGKRCASPATASDKQDVRELPRLASERAGVSRVLRHQNGTSVRTRVRLLRRSAPFRAAGIGAGARRVGFWRVRSSRSTCHWLLPIAGWVRAELRPSNCEPEASRHGRKDGRSEMVPEKVLPTCYEVRSFGP